MAMPPGNVIAPDKMQFPAGGGHWMADERDGFISWLRSEFAAANAIIDSLCQHLRVVGNSGEYDSAISAIHHRRINWTPVLLMQQYFPVSNVAYTLEQIAWKKKQQHQNHYQQQHRGPFVDHQGGYVGKEFRRSGVGFSKHDQNEKSQEAKSSNGIVVKAMEDKGLSVRDDFRRDGSSKPSANGSSRNSEDSEELAASNVENQPGIVNHKGISDEKVYNKSSSDHSQNEKPSLSNIPKTFVATEIYDGKPVNSVDGLRLYNELLDSKEVLKLVSMVNDLRVSGRRGQLQGQTYVVNKRPMKGRGREMIQLGLPVADEPIDDELPTGSADRKVEPIPPLLQEVVDRLVSEQILPVKPDVCIVDFYNEGDHSQPNLFVPWFERPVSLMLLSECDMTFGRVIVSDHPGDFRGSLKLSLTPGSLLLMQGKSSDFSRHAINSIRKQKIIITFIKSIPKRSLPSSIQSSFVPRGPSPSRSPNHFRHPSGATKQYAGVLPTPPPPRPQIPTPNGIQTLFSPASVTPAIPYPTSQIPMAPGPTRWAAVSTAPPRHPPPLTASPGTGVFLPPPGSGNPSNSDAGLSQEKENGFGKSDNCDSTASEDKLDDAKAAPEECNGKIGEEEGGNVDGKQSS